MTDVGTAPAAGSRDWSARAAASFLIGEFLAVNAIRDVLLLVEGPDCVHLKTQFVQGNHDWSSTLTSVSGCHRVANTALHPVQMASSREGRVLELLSRMAAHPAAAGVLLTSMPMAAVTGADYDGLCREVASASGKPVVHVPGRSLGGDWLDGYAEVLTALARRLDLPPGQGRPDTVAVVGLLYDRDEGDCRANVRDIVGLLASLGLAVSSVWLCGGRLADLARVAEAGTILSFPYGRKAAGVLARRTGARLVECPLPLGPRATSLMLRTVGAALGREGRAEAAIEAGLARVVPPLEWPVSYVFQGRRVGFIGDPHLAPGVAEVVDVVGARLAFAALTGREPHCAEAVRAIGDRAPILANPRTQGLARFVEGEVAAAPIDLLVTNAAGLDLADAATLELGFPSPHRHELYERPYLGFDGFLALASDMANAIRGRDAGLDAPRPRAEGLG